MNSPQAHHALSSPDCPAHPREFQSVVDEIPTCSFNDSAADGIALCETNLISHVLAVAFQVSDDLVESVAGSVGKFVLGEHLLEPSDHPARFSLEEHSQPFGDKFSGLRAVLVMKEQGRFSQVLQD